jgi:hypothetical protein
MMSHCCIPISPPDAGPMSPHDVSLMYLNLPLLCRPYVPSSCLTYVSQSPLMMSHFCIPISLPDADPVSSHDVSVLYPTKLTNSSGPIYGHTSACHVRLAGAGPLPGPGGSRRTRAHVSDCIHSICLMELCAHYVYGWLG